MASEAPYRTPLTRGAVRDYVINESSGQSRSDSTLLLNVNHSNLKITRFLELRMHAGATVTEVKERLYLHTGTRPDSMALLVRSSERGPIRAELSDENRTLASYDIRSGDWLHVVDSDPHSASAGGWLEDTSLVPKYVLSEEAYAKKENTYRRFKEKMREKEPNWSMTGQLSKTRRLRDVPGAEGDYAEEAPSVKVDDRVEVSPGGKRGVVKFVGNRLKGLPEGWWVGVVFDEPVGRNDGSVKGERYFTCGMGYGGLVRPSKVEVGDFPERDVFEESEEEI